MCSREEGGGVGVREIRVDFERETRADERRGKLGIFGPCIGDIPPISLCLSSQHALSLTLYRLLLKTTTAGNVLDLFPRLLLQPSVVVVEGGGLTHATRIIINRPSKTQDGGG